MADLRSLSDAALRRQLAKLAKSSDLSEDGRVLLHELELHQVELELQNRELREARQALEVSRDLYADLYDQAPVGYLTLDPGGIVRQINLAGTRLLGAERARVEGWPLAHWIEPGDREGLRAHLRGVLAGGGASLDLRLLPGEGRAREIRLESRHQAASGEAGPACLSAMLDLTERRRVEQQWQDTFDASPDPIFIHDVDYRIVRANRAYAERAGSTVEAVIGRRYFEVFPRGPGPTRGCARGMTEAAGQVEELSTADGGYFLQRSYPLGNHGQHHSVHVLQDLRPLKEKEAALARSEARHRSLVENLPAVTYSAALDASSTTLYVSPQIQGLLGYSPEEYLENPRIWLERLYPADRDRVLGEVRRSHATGQSLRSDYRMVHRDGRVVWVRDAARLVTDPSGGPTELLGVMQDITAHKQAEARMRQSATVFENTQEGVLITDLDARIVAVNRAFTAITGYGEQDALGQSPRILKSDRHDAAFYQAMWASIQATGAWQGEIWNRRKDGELYPQWLTISTVKDASGGPVNYVGVFADMTRLKQSEAELERATHYDPLTDLPNRLLLDARLDHALQRARRHGHQIAVLLLDLDRFKDVNDSFGLPAGDALLQEAARRVSACVRQEDTVARLGGDELLVALEELADPTAASEVAEKIRQALGRPFQVDSREVFLTASIGISLYPENGDTPELLIRHADAAVYRAKEQGRNRALFYTEALSRAALERLSLEAALRRALEREELKLHYQPQIRLDDGAVIGLEALVRWRHPAEGMVLPGRFIPLAEQTGLIVPLGDWVLRSACHQLALWRSAGLRLPRVAVNLSARQLEHAGLADDVARILAAEGLPGDALELEITESAIMADPIRGAEVLGRLAALGVRIAVDDFGTGYSSLAYLKRFPLDVLKIDRSFVERIPAATEDAAICRAVIALADGLGIASLAEGVETEAQRDFLAGAGCGLGQGWLFGRPLSAADTGALLRGRG